MEPKEKIYPSQKNTKAIACRISAEDYVKFLQESISMGINLNDWLLMKIYAKNDQINGFEEESSGGFYTRDNLVDMLSKFMEENRLLKIQMEQNKISKEPNLLDAKIQISMIAKKQFSTKDFREFMAELNELLSDLED
jgi:hypothetical protein